MTKKDLDFDFGFTLVDEEELKQAENELNVQLEQTKKTVESVSMQAQQALFDLRNMINPLLNNLAQGPDEAVIKWPNRKEKIKEFKAKLDNFVERSVNSLRN